MVDVTAEQFNDLFGDLKTTQDAQRQATAKIENIVSSKLENISAFLSNVTQSIYQLIEQNKQNNNLLRDQANAVIENANTT